MAGGAGTRDPGRGPAPAWIHHRTNIEDLLDDGVENGSDIRARINEEDRPSAAEDGSPADEALLRKRDETLAAVRAEQAAVLAKARRRAISPGGVALGLLVVLGGIWLIADPVDMRVEHRRMYRLPTFWEHVTPARSRFYGAAGVACGLLLIGYSLRRPVGPDG